MDRVLKVINILLLSIVGMLLLTGVMVLVQGSKVELGKAADWWAGLSAVATTGTFVVAFIALKKAPDWLGQKKHEDGYNIAKNFFMNDLHELKNNVYNSVYTADILVFEINNISNNLEDFVSLANCESNLEYFRKLSISPFSMKINLDKLKILGWYFTDDSNVKFKTLTSSYFEIQKRHNRLWGYLKSIVGKPKRISNEQITALVTDMIERIKTAEKKFERDYNEFFKHDFETYFQISKNNIVNK